MILGYVCCCDIFVVTKRARKTPEKRPKKSKILELFSDKGLKQGNNSKNNNTPELKLLVG